MNSINQEYLEQLILPHNIIRMLEIISEYKGKQDLYKQQKPEALENMRKVAVIQSTESSNRIEQIFASPERIKALIEESTMPENRSESEIAGYRDVLRLIHDSHESIPFTCNVVLQFHQNLMKYTGKEGGRWKSTNNDITEVSEDGAKYIRFKPVSAFETPQYMDNLHEKYSYLIESQSHSSLLLIPLYILDFLCIHPFLDGNGRMARLLSVLLLYHHGFEVGRYISLERIIENTKESYYDTLKKSSQEWHESNHNSLFWVEYFLSTILAAYREFESRVNLKSENNSKKETKTEIIINVIDNFIGDFSLSDIVTSCPNISHELIKKVIKEQSKNNKISAISKGRYAKWRKV